MNAPCTCMAPFDGGDFLGGGLRAGTRVNEVAMAADAGHVLRQRRVDHLADLTGGLDARGSMAACAGHVALPAHVIVHTLGELSPPRVPCFLVVEIRGHLGEYVAYARGDMRIRLDEKIVHRDVALATTRLNACGIIDMRRLQVVRVGRRTGMRVRRTIMVVAGRTEFVRRCMLVEFYGGNRPARADQSGYKQHQYQAPRNIAERQTPPKTRIPRSPANSLRLSMRASRSTIHWFSHLANWMD